MPRPHKTNPSMTGAGPVDPSKLPVELVPTVDDEPEFEQEFAGKSTMSISRSTEERFTLFDWVRDNFDRVKSLFADQGFSTVDMRALDPKAQQMLIEARSPEGTAQVTINRDTWTYRHRTLKPMSVYREIRYLRAKEGR